MQGLRAYLKPYFQTENNVVAHQENLAFATGYIKYSRFIQLYQAGFRIFNRTIKL